MKVQTCGLVSSIGVLTMLVVTDGSGAVGRRDRTDLIAHLDAVGGGWQGCHAGAAPA